MAHTPGPWSWYVNKALEARDCTVLVGDCGLATCGRTRLYLNEDDARLIAAAPDLLEVLKMLTAAVIRDDNPRDEGHFSESEEMRAALAVIAKAEIGPREE